MSTNENEKKKTSPSATEREREKEEEQKRTAEAEKTGGRVGLLGQGRNQSDYLESAYRTSRIATYVGGGLLVVLLGLYFLVTYRLRPGGSVGSSLLGFLPDSAWVSVMNGGAVYLVLCLFCVLFIGMAWVNVIADPAVRSVVTVVFWTLTVTLGASAAVVLAVWALRSVYDNAASGGGFLRSDELLLLMSQRGRNFINKLREENPSADNPYRHLFPYVSPTGGLDVRPSRWLTVLDEKSRRDWSRLGDTLEPVLNFLKSRYLQMPVPPSK